MFELVALDGLAPAEAAAVLGIGAATGRVRLHRARRALRTALADLDPAVVRRLAELETTR
jgi:RNA polymerase sigma-70 factor (ECF subfamily)